MYSHRRYSKKRDEMNPFIVFVIFAVIAASMLAWVVFCAVSQDKSLGDYMKSTTPTTCVETITSQFVCR